MEEAVEPKSIVELCASNISMRCQRELKFLKSRLKSQEVISIGPGKIIPVNIPVVIVNIPMELRVKLVSTKGAEKQSIHREIKKIEKAQEREVSRINRIYECVHAIQKSISDGCSVICTAGRIEIGQARRGLAL